MQKLLAQYQVTPTDKLAARIRVYDAKHPFASMALTATEQSILNLILGA
tara:strand:- start:193 stop:339 length:147 start_codon:yes stop_codon:yes gene_type:complete